VPVPSGSLLWDLGIEEAESMMCENTTHNRRILRGAKLHWEHVNDEHGHHTGLIRAFTPEETTARREDVWESRKPIMVDPENSYSDYISPLEYPSDYDCLWWIKNAIRQHVGDVHRGVPEEKLTWLPIRCRIVRNDGTRCWNWVSRKNETKCKQHLGWVADEHAQKMRMAKSVIMEGSIHAAETLEELATTASGEAVRLKAATEILDRAGVRGGTEIDMHVETEATDTAIEVKERLSKLAERVAAAELASRSRELEEESRTIDAEVVEDDTDPS